MCKLDAYPSPTIITISYQAISTDYTKPQLRFSFQWIEPQIQYLLFTHHQFNIQKLTWSVAVYIVFLFLANQINGAFSVKARVPCRRYLGTEERSRSAAWQSAVCESYVGESRVVALQQPKYCPPLGAASTCCLWCWGYDCRIRLLSTTPEDRRTGKCNYFSNHLINIYLT